MNRSLARSDRSVLLVFHSSESLLRCAANQQLRLRLGFIFSIYDSDSNGVMSDEEFGYLIEHVGSPQRIVVLVESTPSHRVERASHRKMHAIELVPTSAACPHGGRTHVYVSMD